MLAEPDAPPWHCVPDFGLVSGCVTTADRHQAPVQHLSRMISHLSKSRCIRHMATLAMCVPTLSVRTAEVQRDLLQLLQIMQAVADGDGTGITNLRVCHTKQAK